MLHPVMLCDRACKVMQDRSAIEELPMSVLTQPGCKDMTVNPSSFRSLARTAVSAAAEPIFMTLIHEVKEFPCTLLCLVIMACMQRARQLVKPCLSHSDMCVGKSAKHQSLDAYSFARLWTS